MGMGIPMGIPIPTATLASRSVLTSVETTRSFKLCIYIEQYVFVEKIETFEFDFDESANLISRHGVKPFQKGLSPSPFSKPFLKKGLSPSSSP